MPDPTEEQPDLPEMNDAVLDAEQLASLFRDYRACATPYEIVIKAGPGHVRDHRPPTLDEAEQLLVNRQVRGVQVRYVYDEGQWWDTLMPVDGGVRLVRIRQPGGRE